MNNNNFNNNNNFSNNNTFNNSNNNINNNANNNDWNNININDNNNILNPFPELNLNMENIQMENLIGGENNFNNENSTMAQNNQNNNFNKNDKNNNQNNPPSQINQSNSKDSDNYTLIQLKSIGLVIENSTLNLKSNDKNKNSDEEIEIKFCFFNGPSIPIKAKKNEKFENVIKIFCQTKSNREIMQKYYPFCIHNCNLIYSDKTVYENNIKNGDFVLFYREKKKGEKNELDKNEVDQLRKWIKEYCANKLCEYCNIIKCSKKDPETFKLIFNKDEFAAFLLYKERKVYIEVKEHEHNLVYSLTKFDWKCNICKKDYSKKEGKYYCSCCDYCMCDKCREKGCYDKKRPFPENIPPCDINYKEKFLKTKLHKDNLVLCRTSRNVLGNLKWICNGYRKQNNVDTWSFYCTKCDFDLCSNCAGIH